MNHKEAKNNKSAERSGASPKGTHPEEQKLIGENVSLPKKEYEELKAKAEERDAYSDKYMKATRKAEMPAARLGG